MRKRCHRRPIAAMPPKGLRIMLKPSTVRELLISHHSNFDDMVNGRATIETVWQMAGASMGWAKIAQAVGMGEAEMARELGMINSVIARWERTGSVGFSGPELQTARDSFDVLEQLANSVDWMTACAAVDWAEDRINEIRQQREARRALMAADPSHALAGA
jgi:hypothetical protein